LKLERQRNLTLPGPIGMVSTTLDAGTGISSKPLLISAHTSLHPNKKYIEIIETIK
jgi:hypothetical protein